MPNWVQNKISIDGPVSDIARFEEIYFKNNKLDFNKIIPRPKCLDELGSGSWEDEAIIAYQTDNATIPISEISDEKLKKYCNSILFSREYIENIYQQVKNKINTDGVDKQYNFSPGGKNETMLTLYEAGKKYSYNVDTTGSKDWYEWTTKNWGTKWPAKDIEFSRDTKNNLTVFFNTAWSPPTPIFRRLSEEFPSLFIDTLFVDSNNESECGEVAYLAGKMTRCVCYNTICKESQELLDGFCYDLSELTYNKSLNKYVTPEFDIYYESINKLKKVLKKDIGLLEQMKIQSNFDDFYMSYDYSDNIENIKMFADACSYSAEYNKTAQCFEVVDENKSESLIFEAKEGHMYYKGKDIGKIPVCGKMGRVD